VELEFSETVEVARIIWARDREEKYRDRTPTRYTIELRRGDEPWQHCRCVERPPRQPSSADDSLQSWRLNARNSRKRIATLSAPQMIYAGKFGKAEETFRFHRGDPMQPREKMKPGGLGEFDGFELPMDASDPSRRLALADWIVSPTNPLTARVIVNRLWHYHFGTGIVDTPSDFGLNGGRPSHAALLDWLASELVEHKWSLKHVHRLILTSATYQQASRFEQRPTLWMVPIASCGVFLPAVSKLSRCAIRSSP
jgi:hypothetical protein